MSINYFILFSRKLIMIQFKLKVEWFLALGFCSMHWDSCHIHFLRTTVMVDGRYVCIQS